MKKEAAGAMSGALTGALSGGLTGYGAGEAAGLDPRKRLGLALAGASTGAGLGAMAGSRAGREQEELASRQALRAHNVQMDAREMQRREQQQTTGTALSVAQEKRRRAEALERIQASRHRRGAPLLQPMAPQPMPAQQVLEEKKASLLERLRQTKALRAAAGAADDIAEGVNKARKSAPSAPPKKVTSDPKAQEALEKGTAQVFGGWRSAKAEKSTRAVNVEKAKPKSVFGRKTPGDLPHRPSGIGKEKADIEAYGMIRHGSANGSLTGLAAELYEQGLIRPDVMEHAVKQAAHLKASRQLEQSVKTAAMRRELFGAESPTLEKLAAEDFGILNNFRKGVGQTAGAAVVSAGLLGLEAGVRYLMNSKERNVEESYGKMMANNPEFKQNAQAVRQHFDVLKQFAPSVASNPTAAAGHVRQAIEMGNMIPVDTVRNLVQTEKLHQEAGSRQYLFKN